ncbi:hypothetical protein B0H13DRAFT_1907049 [Mycena leptocephala]|nr:hypothetical protein B0H13DRAFT_1907049 [Mycena leptocephala]
MRKYKERRELPRFLKPEFGTILDPAQKGRYFVKHWGAVLVKEARATAEKIFAERWRKLNSAGASPSPAPRGQSKLSTLLRELTPESDDDESFSSSAHRDPARPWLDKFTEYYDSRPEIVRENISMVLWWGVRHFSPLKD